MTSADAKTPIIILTATEWHDNPVSTMHIAAGLSESRCVIFVETPGRRFPKLSECWRVLRRFKRFFEKAGAGKHQGRGLASKNVIVFSPLAIPLPKYRLIRLINAFLLTQQLKRLFVSLNINNPILWAFSPYWVDVIAALPHQKCIFHCVDALQTYDDSVAFQAAYETIATQANVVFTPGLLIYDSLKRLNPHTHLIGHGCSNAHLFAKPLSTPLLEAIPKPIVVYAGCLANWVDYDLLERLATQLPTISFVLLGYIHSLAPKEKITRLLEKTNVFSLGYIAYEDLPAYYQQSQVGIIPYQADNEHIRHCTPTKILDYFAAGLPCVSTRYPASEALQDYLTVADTADEFAEAIARALQTPTAFRKRLHTYAQAHSWPNQIAKMLNIIEGT